MIQVAGAGPGSLDLLTREVYKAIESSEKVVAFGRIGKSIYSLREDIVIVNQVSDLLNYTNQWKELLILASGDPLFYGLLNFLKNNGVIVDRVLPGISSFQYLMAQIQKPWQDAFLFSLHGREFALDEILTKPLSVGLVDKKHSPTWLSKKLYERGARGKILVGSNLSYQEEIIEKGTIGDSFLNDRSLSVVVIEIDVD